jgi:8-amino-7-oxononanoate synthase
MKTSYGDVLEALEQSGRLRHLQPLSGRNGCRVDWNGRSILNLTSNDYLGIAGNRSVQSTFYSSITADNLLDRYRLGSASSRLLTGDCDPLHELEQELVRAYGLPAALFFNSGYHANIGILSALLDKHDLILSDKLNHASIHDGMRLCSADHKRYRHCDYSHLESLLEQNRDSYERAVIVSESVFSMDGDVADLRELVRIKEKYDCLLYIDEAHAIGLYGVNGLGKAEEQGVLHNVDLLVGPFVKAFASVGAYVLCTEEIRDYLINHSRSLIFTTALPPVVASWNLFVFRMVQGMAGERKYLAELAEKMREKLKAEGLRTDGSTNIVPVLIGDNGHTVRAAKHMQDLGYLIFPVRPPTVPEGTARFRLSLTADMQWTELENLASDIAECLKSIRS